MTTQSLSNYHPVVAQILDVLAKAQVWYETFEHQPVRTSEEAAQLRDTYTLHEGAKALIVRVKMSKADKKFVMLVCPGDLKFDADKVKRFFGAKDIRFATESEVDGITHGVQPGGVPPFGNLFGLEVVVDPSLLANERIIFNAGDKRFSIGMKSQDYVQLVKPTVESII